MPATYLPRQSSTDGKALVLSKRATRDLRCCNATGCDLLDHSGDVKVLQKLERLDGPWISVVNEIEDNFPPLSYKFVNEIIFDTTSVHTPSKT